LNLEQLKEVYKVLVDYAYKLDLVNVEHWELSRPTKNIIVNFPKVYIIDFERWNLMNKNFKNLRWIAQFLLGKQIISKQDLKFENPEKFKEFLTKKIEKIK
jgi:predicted Ser/Thr protein kinase